MKSACQRRSRRWKYKTQIIRGAAHKNQYSKLHFFFSCLFSWFLLPIFSCSSVERSLADLASLEDPDVRPCSPLRRVQVAEEAVAEPCSPLRRIGMEFISPLRRREIAMGFWVHGNSTLPSSDRFASHPFSIFFLSPRSIAAEFGDISTSHLAQCFEAAGLGEKYLSCSTGVSIPRTVVGVVENLIRRPLVCIVSPQA